MASGPGTGVAAPAGVFNVPKGTVHDPALQAAVARAYATNDTASMQAMAPTIMGALSQAQADQASLLGGMTPAALGGAIQSAITQTGQVVQLPAAQQQALQGVAQQFAQLPIQQNQAQVARAQVRRVQASVDPQLEAIRQDLDHRATQIEATAEHRRIVNRDKWQNNVLKRLGAIERQARIPRY